MGLYLFALLVGGLIGVLCLVSPWLALAAIGMVLALALALFKPVLLCYFLVAAITFTSGMSRGILLPLLKPNEAFLVMAFGIGLLVALAARRSGRFQSSYPVVAFPILYSGTVIIPALAYIARGASLSTSDLLVLFAPLQYLVLFWLFAALPETESDRRRLVKWMLICAAVVAVVGLMQAARIGLVLDLLNRWYPSSHVSIAASGGRITSLLTGWNVLGIFMMVNVLIAWILMLWEGPSVEILLPLALCAACLIASGSFAGILGLAMGIALIHLLYSRGLREVVTPVAALLLMAAVVFLFQPIIQPLVRQRLDYQFRSGWVPQTLQFRFQIWQSIFWPIIKQNLAWGTRLTIPTTLTWQWAESEYLLQLFRFGVFGLAAHLAWAGITLVWLYRRLYGLSGFPGALALSAFVILVVLTVAGLTNSVFTFLGAADYLWILLALVAASGVTPQGTAR